jgi:transposase
MCRFFGGTPQVVVPDNLKAAVTRPGREPEINRVYRELARHYRFVIVPARVRKPRDKAKAEVGVQFAQRWVSAALRNQKFFSLAEINAAIAELLPRLNERPFKRFPGCRRSRFLELDKPMLRPLPSQPFQYGEWTGMQKIGLDYHIYVDKHYYSVPCALVHESVDARLSHHAVEIFHKGKRIATHVRSHEVGGHTTLPEHQPPEHRQYAEQTQARFVAWAQTIGTATVAAVQHQFASRPYGLLAQQACSTLQSLAKTYGEQRFETACRRAQAIGSLTVKSIRSILQRKLKDPAHLETAQVVNLPHHANIRGASYFGGSAGGV